MSYKSCEEIGRMHLPLLASMEIEPLEGLAVAIYAFAEPWCWKIEVFVSQSVDKPSEPSYGTGSGNPKIEMLERTWLFQHTFDQPGTYNVWLDAYGHDEVVSRHQSVVVQGGNPLPPPLPPPPPPPSTGLNLTLLGGWRIVQEFARGSFAIDFNVNRLYMAGHSQRGDINIYDLPPMGTGDDISQWPIVEKVAMLPTWGLGGDPYGIAFFRGKLWVSPRRFYDTAPPATLTLYAQDGEQIIVNLPRNQFAGFVKRQGQDPMLGGGGNYSGQGYPFGVTLGTIEGQSLRTYGTTQNATWDNRCPRPPNYYPHTGKDEWYAMMPRPSASGDGTMEGRWAVDRVWGGGLVLGGVAHYWPQLGTGDIDYAHQNETFATTDETWLYRYDATTGALIDFKHQLELGKIVGQDIGPDGKVYLMEANKWKSGLYLVDPVLRVFTVN